MRLFKKGHILGIIPTKELFKDMNYSQSYCKMNASTSFAFTEGLLLKGTKRQYSGQMSQIFKTVKTIEIWPIGQTEVCDKI